MLVYHAECRSRLISGLVPGREGAAHWTQIDRRGLAVGRGVYYVEAIGASARRQSRLVLD